MYIGASLALVADLTPPHLLVPSTALFMFFVTIIAGNCPLLIPWALNGIIHKTYHTFTIEAAPIPPAFMSVISNDTLSTSRMHVFADTVEYFSRERSAHDLRVVMVVTICALYAISSVVYFAVMLFCPPKSAISSTSDESSERDNIDSALRDQKYTYERVHNN